MNDNFKFYESEDPTLYCDQYILKADKNISIQVYGSKWCPDSVAYCVNKWVKDKGMYHKGSFKTLNDAMIKALEVSK